MRSVSCIGRPVVAVGLLAASTLTVHAGDSTPSNPPTNAVLLIDSLGRVVAVPTNELPPELQPPGGVSRQIPEPVKGAPISSEVQQRIRDQNATVTGLRFSPSTQSPLMPYLASQDEFGNTAIKPGALFPVTPVDLVQQGKYWLSDIGFRYSLQQTATFVTMSDVMQGDQSLGFYTLKFASKWTVFTADGGGTAGWISSQVNAQTGLGPAGDRQDARTNLGTTADPTSLWSSHEGWRVPELAWQQSFCDGKCVLLAGIINQANYLDDSSYASTARGQFLNSALVNSDVLPLPSYNFGLNLQWQPVDEWYVLIGPSMGRASAGERPWTDFSSSYWSLEGEIGYAPKNLAGLGPGIYRIQPFIAESDGWTQGGLCFNLQQQLGQDSPFGWFGRFGFGGSRVTDDAKTQIGTGVVFQGPFNHLLLGRFSNDFLGVGFVWSQPSATTKTIIHENEYVLETTYTLQLTPLTNLQPDLQIVWDPTFNSANSAVVFQLQAVLKW